MSRYRKINPGIWNDARFRSMSNRGKLSFFLLLTHPNTSAIGTLRAVPAGLEHDLEGFAEGFREVLAKGMAKASRNAPLIYLPKFLRHNPPESPNCVKAWRGAVEDLPECDMHNLILQELEGFAEGLGEAFRKAFLEGFPKGLPYQEQEQEQELEQQEYVRPLRPTGSEAGATPRRIDLEPGATEKIIAPIKRREEGA